jgi:hypothetical protein
VKDENLEFIIRKAFKKGEFWGVTYSTWFTPSKADTEKQIKKAIANIKRSLTQKGRKHSL